VVHAEAEVLYLIRAPKNSLVKEIFEWVCDIARGAAMMTQTQVQIQIDKACSNLIPNETLEKIMHANLQAAPLPVPTDKELEFANAIRGTLNAAELDNELVRLVEHYGEREGRRIAQTTEGQPLHTTVLPYKTSEKPMMGSTDVADVSWIVPTVQCNTSCYALATPGHSWQLVAQGLEPWAHKGMLLAAKVMAATALDLIQQPEKLEEAKAELKERLGSEPYRCPIPEGVNPAPVK
jgi:aminobenzoyl-glutamate utilization protein B